MKEKLAINGGKKTVTIPYKEKWKKISWREIISINKLLLTGVIDVPSGGVIEAFEREFANFESTKYALAQCNGTSTLHAAYFACGVSAEDDVIVPSYTFPATIAPIIHCGATPIFTEIDPKTLTIDPNDIRDKITSRTKVIVVVHVWGNVARMDEIMEIAREKNIKVIEDASHAPGASLNGRSIGSIGDIGCFSMQGVKSLSASEGGVVVTDDIDLYERMLILGHPGKIEKNLKTETYKALSNYGLGIKYRAHPYGIAMASVQLKRLPKLNDLRRTNYEKINNGLKGIKGIELIEPIDGAVRGGFLEFKLRYLGEELNGVPCRKFVEAVVAEGATKVTVDRYSCCHLLPIFNDFNISGLGGQFYEYRLSEGKTRKRRYKPGDLPITENTCNTIFSIPAFIKPPKGLVEQYILAIHKVVEHINEL